MSSLDHIILYIVLFIIFYIFCRDSIYHKKEKDFWLNAAVPIIFFALLEGCRYDRGPDWQSYKFRFEHINPENEPQRIFLFLMQILNELGVNYVGAYIIYAFIFILGSFIFIRKTFSHDVAKWAYLFLLFSMLIKSELMIRQYIALPFMFLTLSCIIQKKWVLAIITFITAYGTHAGTLVIIPFFIFFHFIFKKIIPLKISVVALFLAYFIIQPGVFTDLGTKFLNVLNLSSILGESHVLNYIEDSERWLGADSFIEDSRQTFVTKTWQYIFDSAILISGYMAIKIKNNNIITTFYNIVCIGFILERLFFGYEIFQRMTGQLYIYWFIPLAYAVYTYKTKPNNKEKYKIKMYVLIAIFYQITYYSRFIFFNPTAEFIWS